MTEYDYIVIGGGSAGLTTSKRAASHGAKVAMIEGDRLGGTCVNRGCVPKKILAYAASFANDLSLSKGYGFTHEPAAFDWSTLITSVEAELQRLNGYFAKSVAEAGVTLYRGFAKFTGPDQVEVNGEILKSSKICIAVGGTPSRPNFPGAEQAMVSDDVFLQESLPKRIVVQGSGYIGVEMASIFRGLGSEVTLMFRSELPLPEFDKDIRSHLMVELGNRGIKVLPKTEILAYQNGTVKSTSGDIGCDALLCATGRKANLEQLDLKAAGVEVDTKGLVKVGPDYATTQAGVYSVGDCTDTVQLTPYANTEGRLLADQLFSGVPHNGGPKLVPTAVFSLPPCATVGLTEAQARKIGPVDIYRTQFRPMRSSFANSPEKVLIKLVVSQTDQKVLGIHLLGPESPELIQALGIAMTCGVTKAQIDATLAVHPSVAEEIVFLRTPVK